MGSWSPLLIGCKCFCSLTESVPVVAPCMINQGIASLVATSECSLLATAIVLVYNSSSDSLEVRALLDSGSQFNFITKRMAHKLKLTIQPSSYSISGIGNSSTHFNQCADFGSLLAGN